MKYYEVAFETSVCFSCNIIKGETEAACRYAAEQHAKKFGYTVATFSEIEESALKYNRKPVWSADEYPQPTEPEQPGTETNEQEETKMKNAEFIAALTAQLATVKNRSAWGRGVQQYAEDFAAELAENLDGGSITLDDLRTGNGAEEAMLNGADNWNQYSYGGSSYIYNWDIARILCTPSELKRTRNGERNPNSRETWLDVQARALFQACNRTKKAIRRAFEAVEDVH